MLRSGEVFIVKMSVCIMKSRGSKMKQNARAMLTQGGMEWQPILNKYIDLISNYLVHVYSIIKQDILCFTGKEDLPVGRQLPSTSQY